VTVELFRAIMAEELARIEQALGPEEYARRSFIPASELFDSITTSDAFVDFLTIPAYARLP
jgi:malate synthase